MPGKVRRQYWQFFEAASTARRLGADLYFSPKGFLPRGLRTRGIGSVVVLHDLIPLWYRERFPGYFGRLEETLVCGGLTHTARRADRIVAISQFTAAEIAARTGRREGVHVVHNGIPHVEPAQRTVNEPFLFAVTSALPHKNAGVLLEGYARYRAATAKPLPLVVCGLAPEAVSAEGVTAVRGIDDRTLHGYFAAAQAVLFLPLIEGFGFPAVEALGHGRPVLCSDIPCLREVTSDIAAFVDPQDAGAVAAAIGNIAAHGDGFDERIRKNVFAGFSWDACARGLADVILTGN
jgi:glycosyltransferase involved in cell wall biosynthesis